MQRDTTSRTQNPSQSPSSDDLAYGSLAYVAMVTSPEYALRAARDLILEAAFGLMYKTVGQADLTAAVLALAAYGTWMPGKQVGLTATSVSGDEPSALMLAAAFRLTNNAALGFSTGRESSLHVAVTGTDLLTWSETFDRVISQERLDATAVRARIRESVLALPSEVKTLEQVARLAGSPFDMAYDILKGGVR